MTATFEIKNSFTDIQLPKNNSLLNFSNNSQQEVSIAKKRKQLFELAKEELKENSTTSFSFGRTTKEKSPSENEIYIENLVLTSSDPYAYLFEFDLPDRSKNGPVKKNSDKHFNENNNFIIDENGEKIMIPKRKDRAYDVTKYLISKSKN